MSHSETLAVYDLRKKLAEAAIRDEAPGYISYLNNRLQPVLDKFIDVGLSRGEVPAGWCNNCESKNHVLKMTLPKLIETLHDVVKGQLSFFPRTIKEWNELEPSVAEAKSISQFKAELGRSRGDCDGSGMETSTLPSRRVSDVKGQNATEGRSLTENLVQPSRWC
ncbi:hypothetical protein Bbelb_350840 [Branchiostoma belcheri]|nr:hypothetical protein Bbelb_350840 [Branchiostoma belcheri]